MEVRELNLAAAEGMVVSRKAQVEEAAVSRLKPSILWFSGCGVAKESYDGLGT